MKQCLRCESSEKMKKTEQKRHELQIRWSATNHEKQSAFNSSAHHNLNLLGWQPVARGAVAGRTSGGLFGRVWRPSSSLARPTHSLVANRREGRGGLQRR